MSKDDPRIVKEWIVKNAIDFRNRFFEPLFDFQRLVDLIAFLISFFRARIFCTHSLVLVFSFMLLFYISNNSSESIK